MREPFRAWWMPLDGDPEGELRSVTAGDLVVRYPDPQPEMIRATMEELESAGSRLANRSVGDIIGAVDAAAGRLADPHDALRQSAEALLPVVTGYSPAMIRLILDRMVADWRAAPLHALVETELGGALDGFVEARPHAADATSRRSRAYGPRSCFHVFAGNVPGVAVTSLIRALLVKAPSLGKLAGGEPVLPILFARALASVDADLGSCLALTYWPGGDPRAEAAQQAALDAAEVVVIYGGGESTADLLGRVAPGRRVVVHGPRFSAGAIGDHELEGGLEGTAERVARAVATFDQQGCVSPHAVWVEDRDGSRASAFAGHLAAALQRLNTELPRGTLTAAEASAIQQERGAAEMRGHQDPRVRVWMGEGTDWTVVLDPEPAFRPSCLNRFVRVHPLADLDRLPGILAEIGAYLQSFALEGAGRRLHGLADLIGRAGASRITTFHRLPWPPGLWHHDGAPPLRELVRWADLET